MQLAKMKKKGKNKDMFIKFYPKQFLKVKLLKCLTTPINKIDHLGFVFFCPNVII